MALRCGGCLCRRRSAETRLSDAELEIEALEAKVASLQQLLESEQAAAAASSKALEQSWSTRLAESVHLLAKPGQLLRRKQIQGWLRCSSSWMMPTQLEK